MNAIILRTTLKLLQPLLLMFSLFLLLFGHNAPGGGFAGGLMLASVFALHAIAFDVPAAQEALRVHPRQLIAAGLLLALSSGLVSLLVGKSFLKSLWGEVALGDFKMSLGTPLLFDVGVYLAVSGVSLLIIFSLAEE